MDQVLAHFKEYYMMYAIIGVGLLPVIYLTRKWTVPVILYLVELAIYYALMHGAMHVIVGVTRWFKENSSMRALREDGKPLDTPEWSTPFLEFWNKQAYDPQWLVYVEIALAVIILLLVWKFRPIQFQRKKTKRTFATEKGGSKASFIKNYAEPLDQPTAKRKKKGR